MPNNVPWIRYGYYQTVAVALAHRHFDLSNDEAMLEVEKNPHEYVATPELLTKIANIGVYPTVIKYGDDGRWYPITYGKHLNIFAFFKWKNDF